ncbi:MAG: hypothetical protein ACLPN1_08125 [Dissulfurispiraceae bacterium]
MSIEDSDAQGGGLTGVRHGIAQYSPRPKANRDKNGKYVRNGTAAKSGLNKAILDFMWANVVLFSTD